MSTTLSLTHQLLVGGLGLGLLVCPIVRIGSPQRQPTALVVELCCVIRLSRVVVVLWNIALIIWLAMALLYLSMNMLLSALSCKEYSVLQGPTLDRGSWRHSSARQAMVQC